MDTFYEKYMSKFLGTFSHMHVHVQWNLNDPVINKAVLLGCNKEVDGIQLTSVNWSHPLLTQMPASQIARRQICMCSKRHMPNSRAHGWLWQEQVQACLCQLFVYRQGLLFV